MEKDFIWGVATSAYQIEGASKEGNRGTSIWDEFCKKYPEKILDEKSGDIGCDHYHRYQEDVALMHSLGIQAYRFSISWSRILPQGIGEINKEGINFYRKLVQELIQKGITPFLTMYHWDLPEALEKKGGWLHPDSPEWFANYASILAKEFGDLIGYMITFNEPQVFIGEYVSGKGAPGRKASKKEVLQMAHHVLLGHGRAVQEIRKINPSIQIGYAPTFDFYYPANGKKEEIEACEHLNFSIIDKPNYMWNVTWWSDPILLGRYPKDGLTLFQKDLPNITKEELSIISQPIDFYAQNIYHGTPIQWDEKTKQIKEAKRKNTKKTQMNWSIDPEVMYWGIKFLYERYQKPIYITENGAAFQDKITPDGKIHDQERIEFLSSYSKQVLKAKQEGIPVKGYFIWSLLDNFEWLQGYTKRFGIIYVDNETQRRIIKDSGYWYQNFIQTLKKENP